MTVTESLTKWLSGFDGGIEIDEDIDTDKLAATAEAYGLFKSPGDQITEFVDGSRDVISYHNLLIRQPSQTETMRQSNQAWMEALQRWVRMQSMIRNLPELDGGRKCFAVAVANSFYMEDQTETESVYQINIAVHYTERS